jgi:PAS domain S-box-containing protein
MPEIENSKTPSAKDYRETARRLGMAMDVAAVGLWEWCPATGEAHFDDRYYTMAGYSPGEFPATPDSWRKHIHPDDLATVQHELDQLVRDAADTVSLQFRFRAKNDEWMWILGRGRVFKRNETGRPLWIIGTHTDITDLKRAEEERHRSENRFRQVVEKAHAGIFIAQNGRFCYVNPSLASLSGYSSKELIGRPIVDLVHPKDREMVIDRHIRRLQGEAFQDYYTFRAVNKEGKVLWMDVNAVLLEWQDRPAIMCFLRDITQNKAMERQLLHAQKMQAIGTLAGGVAHDFNNILSAMMGFTEICLAETPRGSRTAHRLSRVMQAGQRASELVNQILAFSRQEETDLKPVNVSAIIKEALKLIRASIPSTITFQTKIDRDVGLVMAEPTRIHQVIMNLCANAAHAMREHGGVMNISLADCEVDNEDFTATIRGLVPGAYVHLTVSDTGHGMEREFIKKIFDPYFTTKKRGEGTGLGLSVVHGIVTGLGGAITVYSESGKGSAFHVYLPQIPAGEEMTEPVGEMPLSEGNETILLVDDEAILLEMTGEMLENLGYTVVSRTSSVEALHAFEANPENYDLLVTDQTMPGMTGLELAENIRGLGGTLPVILCSGFSAGISAKRASAAGIQAVLKKPILRRDLAETIRRVLD